MGQPGGDGHLGQFILPLAVDGVLWRLASTSEDLMKITVRDRDLWRSDCSRARLQGNCQAINWLQQNGLENGPAVSVSRLEWNAIHRPPQRTGNE
jgi:hypothetical protein